MEPCCQVRLRLAEEMAISARLHAECVVLMGKENHSQEEYLSLCEKRMESQRRSEEAFVVFEEHLDSHQCYENLEN